MTTLRKMTMRCAVALIAGVTAASLVGVAAPATAAACLTIPAVAHRGGNEVHTENSLRAFQHARGLGVTMWETDVRLTADGVPVLMHDATLDRTTDGSGNVAAIDAATLRASVRTADGQIVPTLRELMLLAYASQATVLLEVKIDPTPSQWADVLADIDAYGMRPNVILMSFDGPVVLEAQALAANVRTALLADVGYAPVASLIQYGEAYVKHQNSVTEARLDEWSGPLDVYAWTVDLTGAGTGWERMHWYTSEPGRLDGVITNKPGAYLTWQAARTC